MSKYKVYTIFYSTTTTAGQVLYFAGNGEGTGDVEVIIEGKL